MFLQYAAPGAVLPLFTTRLKELGFSPLQTGWTCATQALGALVAPLIVGQVADRWYPAERCLAVCAALGGVLLWTLAELQHPAAVFGACLGFWVVMVPALMLGTTLAFAHLPHPERDFGRVRMWGTVGWVLANLLLGYWFSDPAWLGWVAAVRPGRVQSEHADLFRLGGLLALALAAYALTLPHTPPARRIDARFSTRFAPLAALHLLRHRAFAVYAVCTLGVCVTLGFTTQTIPLFLKAAGIPFQWISPTLTLSQSMEIVSLALLPMLLLRLGVRGTMLLGLVSWVVALGVLTVGEPLWLVVSSLSLNGLCICCFLVSGQVFVNSRARGDIRASAQALVTFTTGLGMLIGYVLAGWVREEAHGEFPPTFGVAAAIALTLAGIFFVLFRDDGSTVTALKAKG
jgi:predicted MFS family arabinose efflux permease